MAKKTVKKAAKAPANKSTKSAKSAPAKKAVAKKPAPPAKKPSPSKSKTPVKKVVAKTTPASKKPVAKSSTPAKVVKTQTKKPLTKSQPEVKSKAPVKPVTSNRKPVPVTKTAATKSKVSEEGEVTYSKPVIKKPVKPLNKLNNRSEPVLPQAIKPIVINDKEKMVIKKAMLSKAIEIQQNIVRTARKAMEEAQQSANEEKNSNEEMSDSFRETMQATRDVYARQVQEGLNGLSLLNRIVVKPQETIKLGSIVLTDFQNYFISAGLGEITIEDKKFVTVSTLTPLYQILMNKKKGDIFMFLDRKYRVLDVF